MKSLSYWQNRSVFCGDEGVYNSLCFIVHEVRTSYAASGVLVFLWEELCFIIYVGGALREGEEIPRELRLPRHTYL